MRLTPPSSNRTCRFPASGSRDRLSPQVYQAVARLSGILQAEAFEVSVIAHILRLPKASLAASVHVLDESVAVGVTFTLGGPFATKPFTTSLGLERLAFVPSKIVKGMPVRALKIPVTVQPSNIAFAKPSLLLAKGIFQIKNDGGAVTTAELAENSSPGFSPSLSAGKIDEASLGIG